MSGSVEFHTSWRGRTEAVSEDGENLAGRNGTLCDARSVDYARSGRRWSGLPDARAQQCQSTLKLDSKAVRAPE